MRISSNNLIKIAYMTSVGLGGSFLAKKTSQISIWFWNSCVDHKRQLSCENQKKIIQTSEIIGGLFFIILVSREMFKENDILKQIKNLKKDLRSLEGEVKDIFTIIYNNGIDAVKKF